MISRYQKNEEKYQRILQVINNIGNKALQENLKGVCEKYKLCISYIEERKIEQIILKCIETRSEKPLKQVVKSMIFGEKPSDNGHGIYNNEHNPNIR